MPFAGVGQRQELAAGCEAATFISFLFSLLQLNKVLLNSVGSISASFSVVFCTYSWLSTSFLNIPFKVFQCQATSSALYMGWRCKNHIFFLGNMFTCAARVGNVYVPVWVPMSLLECFHKSPSEGSITKDKSEMCIGYIN